MSVLGPKHEREPSLEQTIETAFAKARDGGIKAAKLILTNPAPLRPTQEVTDKLLAKMRTEEGAKPSTEAFAAARQLAQQQAPPQILPKAISRRIERLCPASAPGASGFRVAHLQAVALAPDGANQLAHWAHLWASAK
eukprot:2515037-Alexandrium_andersonii.AAC.1